MPPRISKETRVNKGGIDRTRGRRHNRMVVERKGMEGASSALICVRFEIIEGF